jgi:hypothetical protein
MERSIPMNPNITNRHFRHPRHSATSATPATSAASRRAVEVILSTELGRRGLYMFERLPAQACRRVRAR